MSWKLLCLALASLCSLGCDPIDFDLTPMPEDRMLERLALGATYVATLYTEDIVSVVAVADPEIVDFERIDAARVRLVGVGVGTTTITFEDQRRRAEFPIEVASPERYEVLLVEVDFQGPVAVGELDGEILLADTPQHFVVRYFDSRGPLSGAGLAEVELPISSERCESHLDDVVDAHCFVLKRGLHALRVTVGHEEQHFGLGAD